MKIVISIVSHNQQALCSSLLQSIDRFVACERHDVKIILTENTTAACVAVSNRFDFKVVYNLRQKGFGENHNSAFERFESDFFFIVNPDIILTKTFDLDLLVEQIMQRGLHISCPEIFGISGILEDYKRSDLTVLNLLKRVVFRNKTEKFDWIAGMFLIVNSNSFRVLKGFDTNFFMYVEDCDLSMRARKLGMKVEDIEGFSVIHNARRASGKSFRHFKWHITSLLRYWLIKLHIISSH